MRIRPAWLFIGCIFMIPCLGTHIFQKYRPSEDCQQSSEGLLVHIKQWDSDQVMDLESYMAGVLGAVLSPDVHEETMRVMAVVLRTYLHYMSKGGTMLRSDQLGQPWISERERKEKGMNEDMIKQAIADTQEYLIRYNESLILPLYHVSSNGKTRTFSDVWSGEMPYLISVDSPWDKMSAEYRQKRTISRNRWEEVLGNGIQLQIVEKDAAGYVKQVQVGADVISGEELRCRLGLMSACFDYEIRKNSIEFICYGQGHGVGLSLYGANAMANEGKTWQEIIEWYFPGTSV